MGARLSRILRMSEHVKDNIDSSGDAGQQQEQPCENKGKEANEAEERSGASASCSSSSGMRSGVNSGSGNLNNVGCGGSSCSLSSKPSSDRSKKRRTFKNGNNVAKKDFFSTKRSKKWPLRGLSSCTKREPTEDSPIGNCICTGYKKAGSMELKDQPSTSGANPVSGIVPVIDLSLFNPADYPIDDEDERMRRQRAKEMAEGVELSAKFGVLSVSVKNNTSYHQVHSQVDYIHCLVPDLKEITSCSFYWGKIDRYEAEKLLEGKPEGTFLLRDSAQEEYLFSVSFRRYGRSLHARIEQWNHSFSFDSHDPSVFSSPTVTGLIEHYKDPSCCMFFEPMLTTPHHRNFPFDLQHLARAAICGQVKYDAVNDLPLPKKLKMYCKEYHYKQRVRYRHLE